jgi:hypothetical protein
MLRPLTLVILLLLPAVAAAQSGDTFQVEGKLLTAMSGEIDALDVGVGGRLSWHPAPFLGVEAELGFYPSDIPRPRPISASRLEGLFGVTVGPRIGVLRPFARIRPGFLRMAEAPGPVACILIFPPPLTCSLAAGHTLLAVDIGGGIEANLARRAFLRVDVGTRLLRYPGPAFDRDRNVHDEDFFAANTRVALGAGLRF